MSRRATDLPDIEVRTYGAGSREVVLLHGGPGAPGTMAPLGRALADAFCVLEPLQRRAGLVPLTVARHVADLHAVMPARAALVGSSWGAMLALSFAAVHPDRVTGLALVGCGTYDEASRQTYKQEMARRWEAVCGDERRSLEQDLAQATSDEERERVFGLLAALATRAQGHDPLPAPDEGLAPDRLGHLETWADVLRLQAEGKEPAGFAGIAAPAVMIHGAEDPHPGRSTYETLLAFLPQLEYVELPRCGHVPWSERHARVPFFALLRAWLVALPA